MKYSDVKFGMRVTPFKKTKWNRKGISILEYMNDGDSDSCKFLKRNGFLYVTGFDIIDGVVLGADADNEDGDFFDADDFEPYDPMKKGLYPEFKHEKLINISEKEYKELIALREFKDYFDELYGTGLQIGNWHQNGNLEAFDNFYDSAMEEYDKVMK